MVGHVHDEVVIVNPARAGMIREQLAVDRRRGRKPRASGDDPTTVDSGAFCDR